MKILPFSAFLSDVAGAKFSSPWLRSRGFLKDLTHPIPDRDQAIGTNITNAGEEGHEE